YMFHVHCTLFADFDAAAAINAFSQIDVEHIIRSGCDAVHWTAICALTAPGALGGCDDRSGSENRVIRKIGGAIVKGLLRGPVQKRRFQACALKAIPLNSPNIDSLKI